MGLELKIDAMKARLLTEPMIVVVGEGRMSMPRGLKPKEGRVSMRAVPRWPAEPVTRTSYVEDIFEMLVEGRDASCQAFC